MKYFQAFTLAGKKIQSRSRIFLSACIPFIANDSCVYLNRKYCGLYSTFGAIKQCCKDPISVCGLFETEFDDSSNFFRDWAGTKLHGAVTACAIIYC